MNGDKEYQMIQSHRIYLYGNADKGQVCLIPLEESHLPYLIKWNQDREILRWIETEDKEMMTEEEIITLYRKAAQSSFCFLILCDHVPIGECWLQPMDIPEIINSFPGQDIRRIDLMLGERRYHGGGIGTEVVRLLTEFTFEQQRADILYNFVLEENFASRKIFLNNGYRIDGYSSVGTEGKEKQICHYILRREDYFSA